MTEAFLSHVKRSDRRLVVAMSSWYGSIADNPDGGYIIYRSTKATLNAAMKSLSIEPRDRGVGVLIMHLGRVRTDMGGLDAQLSPEKSITSLRRVIESASRVKSARLFDFEGKEMPW